MRRLVPGLLLVLVDVVIGWLNYHASDDVQPVAAALIVAGFGGLGRFAEPSVLIMVSLAENAKHGYAITLDVERVAGIRLGPGTLYGAIARLHERGLIEPVPSDDRRRPYRLSDRGAKVLALQLESLRQVAATGLRRLAKE